MINKMKNNNNNTKNPIIKNIKLNINKDKDNQNKKSNYKRNNE